MSMENMYAQLNIKLDALHSLVITMKQDMDRKFEDVDRRFEEVDRRFEEASEFRKEVQQNFARLETKIDTNTARLEAKIDKNTELVNELYRRGDKLELSFSRKVLLGNGLFAGVISFFVAIFTGKMIVEA